MDPISSGIAITQSPTLSTLLTIAIYYVAAWVLSILSRQVVKRLFSLSRIAPKDRRPSLERTKTIQALSASLVNFFFFLIATALSLLLFVTPSTLVWVLGLFSAAFGIAARPVVSDILAGIGFLFKETFDIGEKVEFILVTGNLQGVIEAVNLTTTVVRAPTGEQYSLPNGEIRVVRNFSRGKFSQVVITLFVSPDDLARTLDILKPLGDEAFHQIEGQVEPWQVISSSNVATTKVELTIIAKAVLGKGAELKLQLIDLIHERLRMEDIKMQE